MWLNIFTCSNINCVLCLPSFQEETTQWIVGGLGRTSGSYSRPYFMRWSCKVWSFRKSTVCCMYVKSHICNMWDFQTERQYFKNLESHKTVWNCSLCSSGYSISTYILLVDMKVENTIAGYQYWHTLGIWLHWWVAWLCWNICIMIRQGSLLFVVKLQRSWCCEHFKCFKLWSTPVSEQSQFIDF